MRDLKNNHITYGKGSTNIQSKRTKSFGYQILGFGSGGGAAAQASFDYLVIAGGGATGGLIGRTMMGPHGQMMSTGWLNSSNVFLQSI